MKSILIVTTTLLLTVASAMANDIATLKENIRKQLIDQSLHTDIINSLTSQLFPNGADTDLCLKELVAEKLPSEEVIRALMQRQNEDGSFTHVDYTSQSRSAWPTQKHQEYLMMLAKAYRSPQSAMYNDRELSTAIHRGINFWCAALPQCPNWWYNEIGSPKVFAPLLILMHEELSAEELAAGIKVLDRAQLKMTGQNKVWLAGIVFMKGLLLHDTHLLETSSEAIRAELIVTTNEGIQPDYSFHQHGAQQQFGNYGLAFASSQSYWMRILSGTAYDFSSEQKRHLREYMLNGISRTIWRGIMDISACGRQLFVNAPRGKAASLLLSMCHMISADPEHRTLYEEYISRNYTLMRNDLVAATHFWRSDYTVYRAPRYMVTVKMCSPRVIGSESTNRENLLGYYLADGATYTYCSGKEYENIFPYWNWKLLPGVTTIDDDAPIPFIRNRDTSFEHENQSHFVGGVTHEEVGVSVMSLDRNGLSGRKGWFFVGNQVICLGAHLSNVHQKGMLTGIEQSVLRGEVSSAKNKQSHNGTYKWVLHNNIGYRSLQPQTWILEHDSCQGDWRRVAEFYPSQPIAAPLFRLYIHHPSGESGSYAYAIHPNADAASMTKAVKEKRIKVLANSADQQTVEDRSRKLLQSICYSPSTVNSTQFGRIAVDAPCIWMLQRNEAGGTTLSVADPTQKLAIMNFSWRGKTTQITFPRGAQAGSTLHLELMP